MLCAWPKPLKHQMPQVAKSPVHGSAKVQTYVGTVGQENTWQSTHERGQLVSCETKVTLTVISPVRYLLFLQSASSQIQLAGGRRCSPRFAVAKPSSLPALLLVLLFIPVRLTCSYIVGCLCVKTGKWKSEEGKGSKCIPIPPPPHASQVGGV